MQVKLKTTQIAPVRAKLSERQQHICPLCLGKMGGAGKKPALDHCHVQGHIRGVLCLNCNGMEGKIFNLARRGAGKGNDPRAWLHRLLEYLETHRVSQHRLIHPTYKSEADKRAARNAKARKKRAALKLKGK